MSAASTHAGDAIDPRARDYLERAAEALHDANARCAELEAQLHEPIAIIGAGCRLPGGIRSPEDLWRFVDEERDAIGPFPRDRGWDFAALFDPDRDRPGTSHAREGGFIYDATDFDAAFFRISPREALTTDPQQRLALEVCWEAVEHARLRPRELRGSSTAVYLGVITLDYGTLLAELPAELEGQLATASLGSVVSGRVAYVLDLKGPVATLDTACSSSLYTIHDACSALRRRECSLALAGGVSVMSTPGSFTVFSRQRGLAPDGRCKPFSDRADGTGWSEGAGVVVLERLSDALAHGRNIHAVVRGSAVNHDGTSAGLTVPTGPAQEEVIRRALAAAQLSPADIDVIEAHGTGTALGDPIEARALMGVFGRDPARSKRLYLGSVKSNVGHTQSAAGVTGVIKMMMALSRGRLPATIHADQLTRHVQWNGGPLRVLQEPVSLEVAERPTRAGISAFGISGTNAHVVLESAPVDGRPSKDRSAPTATPATRTDAATPILLSAADEGALADAARRLADHIRNRPELHLDDIAWSLAHERDEMAQRAGFVASGRDDAIDLLTTIAAGVPARQIHAGRATMPGRCVFAFPGQGSQWPGMGRALAASMPAFREALARCDTEIHRHAGWSVLEVLEHPEKPAFDRVDIVQPALFAVMTSLAEAWRTHGVTPDAVVGHSQGEIAAAVAAGAISITDAARLVVGRSRVLRAIAGAGGMLAVSMGADALAAHVNGTVAIAACNGPSSTVLSGPPEALAAVAEHVHAAGARAHTLPVTYASHGPQIDAIETEIVAAYGETTPQPASVPFYSSVDARVVDTDELDARYWYRNLREPVRFQQTVAELLSDGYTTFIECSPHPVLAAALQENIEASARRRDQPTAVLATLHRDGDACDLTTALVGAWVAGQRVDWSVTFGPSSGRSAPLPTYAFQQTRYWPDHRRQLSVPRDATCDHPILQSATDSADGRTILGGTLDLDSHPWLADHEAFGLTLAPGALLAELALSAARHHGDADIAELVLERPLVLDDAAAHELQVILTPDPGGQRSTLTIHSRPDQPSSAPSWTLHARGHVSTRVEQLPQSAATNNRWPLEGDEIAVEECYRRLARLGLDYGPAFRALTGVWVGDREIYATVQLPRASRVAPNDGFTVHPVLLDAALQALAAAVEDDAAQPRLPFAWTGLRALPTEATSLRAIIELSADGAIRVRMLDEGTEVLRADGLELRPVSDRQLAPSTQCLFDIDWRRTELPPAPAGVLDWTRGTALDDLLADGMPEHVTVSLGDATLDDTAEPAAARRVLSDLLERLQAWLTDPRTSRSRLTVLTRSAVATAPGEPLHGIVQAGAWGLLRSAQAEHPDRFGLLDLDDTRESAAALGAAIRIQAPQLALRAGTALTPRLTALTEDWGSVSVPNMAGASAVITGGTGMVGGRLAQHLVRTHSVAHLLLLSRRGPELSGVGELAHEIEALGAEVNVVACDVSDREALANALRRLPADKPLGAVIHAAATLEDATVMNLTSDRLRSSLAAKVDGAWNLDELTRESEPRIFALISSASGVLGAPGQAAYAAANAMLDALAARRRFSGLPATALAYGLWETESDLTAQLGEEGHRRLARLGVAPLGTEEALDLFDRVVASGRAIAVPARLSTKLLRQSRRRSPTAAGSAPSRARGELRRQYDASSPDTRQSLVEQAILKELAEILEYEAPSELDASRSFLEYGVDSVTGLELRSAINDLGELELAPGAALDAGDARSLATVVVTLFDADDDPRSAESDANPEVTTLIHSNRETPDAAKLLTELGALAESRERSADPVLLAATIKTIFLTRGAADPRLILLPSVLAGSGPHQYAKLARTWSRVRAAVALSLPGFRPGEVLPAGTAPLIEALARQALYSSDGAPMALAGHSTGGLLAYAVAAALERRGHPPAVVILLDTYAPDELNQANLEAAIAATLAPALPRSPLTDEALTAMGAYSRLLGDLQFGALASPVHLIRSDTPMPGVPDDVEWRASWAGADQVIEVRGDHFSILQDHAESTAAAVDALLT